MNMRKALNAEQQLRIGTYGEDGQALWWSYYDSFLFDSTGANTLQQLFFTEGIGGASGKTLADTNFRGQGTIPSGQKLEADALELYYVPSSTKTLAQWQNIIDMISTGYLIVDISTKSNQLELPLAQMFGSSMPVATSDINANPLARAPFNTVWELPIPIVLASQTTFNITMAWSTAPNASLDGDKVFLSFVGGLVTLQ